jgi:ankyrin repeat protein
LFGPVKEVIVREIKFGIKCATIRFTVLTVLGVAFLYGCAGPASHFDTAKRANTARAYEDFLRKYPQSEFTAEAQRKIDDIDFQGADNSIDGLNAYLLKHTSGVHIDDAKTRIDTLKYKEVEKIDTEKAYEEFIAQAFSEDLKQKAQTAMKAAKKRKILDDFMSASQKGNLETIHTILNQGLNPDAKDKFGNTALIYAVDSGHKEIVKLLLSSKANPNICEQNGGQPPLFLAVGNDNKEITQMLLDAGADINYQIPASGITALMMASGYGSPELVRLLLAKGGNPKLKAVKGDTALEQAVFEGYCDVVELLINGGADVNNNINGYLSPLCYAVRCKDYPMVCLLLKAGAHDLPGDQCLRKAQENNDIVILRVLQASIKKKFDYKGAIKDPAMQRPASRPTLKDGLSGALTVHSTGVIEAIKGRKITIKWDGGGVTDIRLRGRTALKKPILAGQLAGSLNYQPATISDFRKGDQVTIETLMNSNIILEMRQGAMMISNFGIQTK